MKHPFHKKNHVILHVNKIISVISEDEYTLVWLLTQFEQL